MNWCLLGVVLAALQGCSEDPGSAGAVLAIVGERPVTEADLVCFIARLPPALRSREREREFGRDAVADYLWSAIDRELLLLEATRRGLDTTWAVCQSVDQYVRRRILLHYAISEIVPEVRVEEEEVQQAIEEAGLHRQRRIWGIAVGTRDKLKQVLTELEVGAGFEDVARLRSIDAESAARGGEIGYVDIEQCRRMGVPKELFCSLPDHRLSPPLESLRGHFVVRFTDPREHTDSRHWDRLREELWERRLRQREEEHTERLARLYDWRPADEGLVSLLERGRRRTAVTFPLTPADQVTPLFVFHGGQVTIADYIETLRAVVSPWGLEDSLRVDTAVRRFMLQSVLFERAARDRGVPHPDSVAAWRARKMEEELLVHLRAVAVVDSVSVSEEEIRSFYEAHPYLFKEPEAYWITEVLVATEAEAQSVLFKAQEGVPLDDLARRVSLRKRAVDRGGILHLHPLDRQRYPLLVQAVMEAEPGQLQGPITVHGGYSIFRLERKETAQLQSLDVVRTQVKALVRRRKVQERFERYVADLRHRYENLVLIHREGIDEGRAARILEAADVNQRRRTADGSLPQR